jgi:hypothetical protein
LDDPVHSKKALIFELFYSRVYIIDKVNETLEVTDFELADFDKPTVVQTGLEDISC